MIRMIPTRIQIHDGTFIGSSFLSSLAGSSLPTTPFPHADSDFWDGC